MNLKQMKELRETIPGKIGFLTTYEIVTINDLTALRNVEIDMKLSAQAMCDEVIKLYITYKISRLMATTILELIASAAT